jgi:FkbM family methyltransferase
LFIAGFLWLGISPVRRGKVLAPLDVRVLNALAHAIARLDVARLCTTEEGVTIRCDPADWLQAHIAYFGAWEPHITGFIKRRLGKDDVFLDVGANIGYYSLIGARLCRKVIAVEATPSIFASLRDNIALNRAGNVAALNVAVAAEDGEVQLFRGPDFAVGQATLVEDRARLRGCAIVETIAGRRLQSIVEEPDLAHIRLIKIDIEGAERPVLEQIMTLAPKLRHDVEIIVELDPLAFAAKGASVADLLQRFEALGFYAYAIANSAHPFEYVGRSRLKPPTRLTQVPNADIDLVLSRVDADVL